MKLLMNFDYVYRKVYAIQRCQGLISRQLLSFPSFSFGEFAEKKRREAKERRTKLSKREKDKYQLRMRKTKFFISLL